MTFLLDVNVLIALIDPAHVSHDHAHEWFADGGGESWATCPLTENAVIRIVGHGKYPNTPGPPAVVADVVRRLRARRGHVFWPDDASLLDEALFDTGRMLIHKTVTDTYLLGLAVAHGGKLASLDRRLDATAVRGGKKGLVVI